MGVQGARYHATLVDWTAPGDRLRSSVSEGSGRQVEDAIAGAFAQWEENARYDEGYIAWQFNARDVGGPVSVTQGRFETDGATVWDTFSSVTGWASVGLVLGGLALSALIPPAAPAVTAMVWGSIFTGATASVVNLAQNYNEGYRDWRSNGLDVLSLVSLGAAGVWARGAKIALTGGQTAMRNAGMFGQLTADGWQGVIMADDLLDEWEAVNADPSLSPDERLDKLVQLARNAVLAGTLLSLSFKGTAKDLKALKAGEFDPAHLKRLSDPKAHLTEADAQPVRKLEAGETEKTLTLQPNPEDARPEGSTLDYEPHPRAAENGPKVGDRIFKRKHKDGDVRDPYTLGKDGKPLGARSGRAPKELRGLSKLPENYGELLKQGYPDLVPLNRKGVPDPQFPNFMDIRPVKLKPGTRIYRIVDEAASDNGAYWAYEKPANKRQWREDYAVKDSWNDNGYYVEYTVKEKDEIYAWEGRASAQSYEEWNGKQFYLPGGGVQLYIQPGTIETPPPKLTHWSDD